jgi:pyruvate kinase
MKLPIQRTLAFALARGKGEAESFSRLEATFGDNTSTECTWSFDFPDSKDAMSHLKSEADLSGSNGANNVASVIEKLNALRSHLLAAEKWNASQLHLCDRFVNHFIYSLHYLFFA